MRKLLIALTITLGFIGFVAPSASAAAPTKPLKCVASDPAFVLVDSENNSVTITDNAVGGNNFGCYTNITVTAGDTITFNYLGTCGGGVPRLFIRFTGGQSENTFDNQPCSTNGTVTYLLQNSGKIKSFAFINDRGDGSTVTYSNLVIAGQRIDF